MNQTKKIFFIGLGSICLALGTIGIFIPILPTVPFYLATAFCYANSSKHLHDWFINTKLYREHLDTFVQKKAMTLKAKIIAMGSISLLMLIGFIMMKNTTIGRIILAIVWFAHLIYFCFGIKTLEA